MKFKQFQFLRDRTIEKLKSDDLENISELGELSLYDSLSLAYIGDAVFSMYVRKKIIMTGITKVRVIHHVVTSIICAKAQAKAYLTIEPILNEVECKVGRRARNSNVSVPKSAEVWEYRCSTALEAILGYLYLTEKMDRLYELCEIAVQEALKEV